MTRRTVTVEDLLTLRCVGFPCIAPDGRWVVHTVMRPDVKEDRHLADLWLAGPGMTPRQLTFTATMDSNPALDADGRRLAFLRTEKTGSGSRTRLCVLSLEGGEAQVVCEERGSYGRPAWSPDGTRLAFTFAPEDPDQDPQYRKEGEETPPQRYRVVDRLDYRMDGLGYLPLSRAAVRVLDLVSGKSWDVADGPWEHQDPVFSPDGSHLAFGGLRDAVAWREHDRGHVYVVPVEGGEVRALTAELRGPFGNPSWSPDGTRIACTGHLGGRGEYHQHPLHIWCLTLDGSARPVDLTPGEDRNAEDELIADHVSGWEEESRPCWSADGAHLYYRRSDQGAVEIVRLPSGGGTPEVVVGGRRHITSCSLAPRAGLTLAYVASDHTHPGELYLWRDGQEHRLTEHNEAWRQEVDLREPEELWLPGGGGTRQHGWLLAPGSLEEGRRYPLLVEIHGGPHGMYGYSLFHEMHLLAAQGYFVYWANPRGSAGYGLAHLLPLVEHWGEPDTEDLMTALDHLLAERPYLDPERVGVLGGSYGGFMTSWLVGHTDRFRAAVSQRAVNNLASFFGTSDFGYYFETTFGGTPWSQPGRYRERSPITYVERVTTPLLIIHSEQDLRCPISQAEELFAALKIIGKAPAELVRFSGESHGLSRGGRPRNRMERLRRILDWFERYL